MTGSYKVRIWSLKTRKNSRGVVTSYGVRWAVNGHEFYESYKTRAQAESRRAELISAQRRGEPFEARAGLPRSLTEDTVDKTWYEFACEYVDVKWPKAAATYRRTIAETLAAVSPVMLRENGAAPEQRVVRSTLTQWAFNTPKRERSDRPDDVNSVLRWIEKNSLPVSDVMRPEIARALHDAAVTRLDGKPGARSFARQRRMILNNAVNYAVELGWLPENPVKAVKWTAPKPSRAIDDRRVANPVQVRTLLRAVGFVERSGPWLAAAYAAMYFAALRPEEAVNIRHGDLALPKPLENGGEVTHQWGRIYAHEATPHAGKAWTDSGRARDARGLKHRERGEGRSVPCPPELTRILRDHLARWGTDSEGRLFRGEAGGEVPLITWSRVWRAARAATLTEHAQSTPLARRPYDLRHAAVSTWLNGGVPATTVAEWAGHSVEVLLEVYAKCLTGQEQIARQQVERALGH